MLIAVERDLFQHPSLHGAGTAAQVVESLPTGRNQPVKQIAAHEFEAAAHPGPAPADGQVRLIQGAHQLTHLDALNLVVGRRGHNQATRSPLKSCHERRGLAEALGETDDREILAPLQ